MLEIKPLFKLKPLKNMHMQIQKHKLQWYYKMNIEETNLHSACYRYH